MTAEKKRFSSVNLPENADGPYEIFVNGVPQHDQDDYVLEDRTLYFFKPIRKEEKLGFWRWLVLFIGIAGSYKQNDSVDVTFTRDGARFIDTGLKITVLIEPTEEEKKSLAGSYSPGG